MKLINLCPGSWGSNCYLLISGGHAAVVDPSAEPRQILSALERESATLDYILLTHGHFDHIVSLDRLRDQTNAPALIHEEDLELPADPIKNAFFSFFCMEQSYRTPERSLTDGEELMLGEESIRVLHTPGHTRGSCCFLCGGELLLTGDTLFDGAVGRTDLYGGNGEALLASLLALRGLAPSLPIYPGHGGSALLGEALDSVLR